MALRTLIEFINAFSISISISHEGVDRSIFHDQQKQTVRSQSIWVVDTCHICLAVSCRMSSSITLVTDYLSISGSSRVVGWIFSVVIDCYYGLSKLDMDDALVDRNYYVIENYTCCNSLACLSMFLCMVGVDKLDNWFVCTLMGYCVFPQTNSSGCGLVCFPSTCWSFRHDSLLLSLSRN